MALLHAAVLAALLVGGPEVPVPPEESGVPQPAAGPSQGPVESEAVTPAGRLAGARAHRWNGALLLGLGVVAGAQATWAWGDEASYPGLGSGGSSGPQIDPVLYFTPVLSPVLTGLGSARIVEAAAYERGLAPSVSWTHWLGWVPASVAIGTEIVAVAQERPPTRAQRTTIAIGTAASVLYFLGSTAVQIARLPDRTPVAKVAVRREVSTTLVVPMIAVLEGNSMIGASVFGSF